MVENMFFFTFIIMDKGGDIILVRKTFTTTIDEGLQKAFKKTCAEKGEKMNDVLESFMQGYIKGDFTLFLKNPSK